MMSLIAILCTRAASSPPVVLDSSGGTQSENIFTELCVVSTCVCIITVIIACTYI